jgi:DNA-binding transcriptional ArsR family regulator
MSHLPGFSATAFLIADPTRAVMLTALLDGRALPAGELAYAAGITAQTASTHLAKLLAGGLAAALQIIPSHSGHVEGMVWAEETTWR